MRCPIACLLLVLFADPVQAQAEDAYWYPVLKPTYFYSPEAGFGAGIGFNGSHILKPGDMARLRLSALQYRQFISAGWARGRSSPNRPGPTVSVRAIRNLREGFYGVGPESRPSWERTLHRNMVVLELRNAWTPTTHFWIQPRFALAAVRLISAGSPGQPPQRGVRIEPGTTRHLEVGLDGTWRPSPDLSVALHMTSRRLTRGDHQAVAGMVILMEQHLSQGRSLHFRVLVDRTITRSDLLPYHVLPGLDDRLAPGWDRYRFYGNDRVVIGAAYVQPVLTILKSHVFEGLISVSLSQVYHDLWRDFSPSVAIAPDRDSFSASVPLEPTWAIGGRFRALRSNAVLISMTLGFSVEGLQASNFSLQPRLSDWYPVVR